MSHYTCRTCTQRYEDCTCAVPVKLNKEDLVRRILSEPGKQRFIVTWKTNAAGNSETHQIVYGLEGLTEHLGKSGVRFWQIEREVKPKVVVTLE